MDSSAIRRSRIMMDEITRFNDDEEDNPEELMVNLFGHHLNIKVMLDLTQHHMVQNL
jgi:hypothetical protein